MGRAFQDEPSLQAGLDGSACLGAWLLDGVSGHFVLPARLGALLGLPAGRVAAERVLSGIHSDDGLRVESVLCDAAVSEGAFEVEFRTRAGPRWLRLMGRTERIPEGSGLLTRGLAFDLTEGLHAPGTPAQRAQRQANQLAGHAIAMLGLAERLSSPPLSRSIEHVAEQIAFELARHITGEAGARRH